MVARGERRGVEGYASFLLSKASGALDFAYAVDCRHLVASSLEGYASLLSYMRTFRGLGEQLRFAGPPAHPLGLLVEEQDVRPVWTYRWMLRLLDVPGALEGRGYPPVSGEVVFAVEDALFPENRGPWRVVASEGDVRVERATGARTRMRPIPIGTLSSIYSGYLSAFDAVALGTVEEDVAPGIARLFGGPAPWMHDFF